MREGTIFTGVCLFAFRGGEGRVVPHLADGGGGTPSQVQVGGYTHPRGYPHPPGPGKGITPPPHLGRGIPPPGPGKWVPPLSRPEKGYSPPPPIQVRSQDGGGGGTPNQNSIACTCYVAGGMPLAFTQEDFLVLNLFPIGVETKIKNIIIHSPVFCSHFNLLVMLSANCM